MAASVFLRRFCPEAWSSSRRFKEFAGPPFVVDNDLVNGVASVVAHEEKYDLLGGLVNDTLALLEEDEAELTANGFSNGLRGRQLAALFEAEVAELYSALGGLRSAVHSIYRKVPRVQNESTEKFFRRAHEQAYGAPREGQPGAAVFSELCVRLGAAYATWFPMLRTVRTMTTHGVTGMCHGDRQNQQVLYVRMDHDDKNQIPNAIQWLNDNGKAVRELTEWFFGACFLDLDPVERGTLCGVYEGYIYERLVAPRSGLADGDGRCLSRVWFEGEALRECPIRTRCAAYARPVSAEERAAYYDRQRSTS